MHEAEAHRRHRQNNPEPARSIHRLPKPFHTATSFRKPTDLTYEIKLALAEHSQGDICRTELRDRLRDAIKAAVLSRVAQGSG